MLGTITPTAADYEMEETGRRWSRGEFIDPRQGISADMRLNYGHVVWRDTEYPTVSYASRAWCIPFHPAGAETPLLFR